MKQTEAQKAAGAEAGAEAGAGSAAEADAGSSSSSDGSSSGGSSGIELKQRSLSISSEGVSIKVIDLSDIAGGESSSGSSTSSTAGSAAKQPQAQQQAQQQAAGPPEATATAAAAAPAPAAAAERQQQREQPDEDLVEIEKKIPVRAKQHPLLAALYRAQMVSPGHASCAEACVGGHHGMPPQCACACKSGLGPELPPPPI